MVNLIISNKNNTLKVISNILDATVDKGNYKLEFKNELYSLNIKQSMLIKVIKILKENEKLKLKQKLQIHQRKLLLKLNLNGLKVVWLQKANIRTNILNRLKIIMSFGKKKEKELHG